ncbi:hypothetical protein MKW98_011973, partial [Papaver atlanticum]
ERTAGNERTINILLKDCDLWKQQKKIEKSDENKVENPRTSVGRLFRKLPPLETMECFQDYRDIIETAFMV